ncbi:MAG: UvrD-helicase domain-containing protein, partial [Chloroflexi bacterium]|nr:UvrD-helicase domain-containing protein [Chloroflexota bacterium]
DFTPDSYFNEIASRVYAEYQKLLRQNNAYDFDDLLCEVVYLFRNQPDVLKKYQTQYDHVLVDEFQDTNTAQYAMVNLLSATKRNLYVVGDPDQCLPTGTLIQTPSGTKPIEKIKVGDQVLAASGRGATMPARVNHIEKRPHQGTLVKVTTRKGYSFSATPNHIIFARLGRKAGLHYVYLMYRKDKGCRVGIASHARSDGVRPELQIGLKVRSNQENADRMWVLKVCASRDDAYYWESFYAFKYGIPTTVFHVRGRRMRTSQESINRLYASIDTVHNAKRLLDELGMDWRFPHFIPQGIYRNLVNLRYFGDGRRTKQSPWNAHRIDLWSNDPQLRQQLKQQGYKPRTGGGKNWRLGFSRLHYDDAQSVAKTLCKQVGDSEIITGAFLIEGKDTPLAPRFSLMPASHLHPSMIVAIEKKGQVIEDEIIQVSEEDYRGNVYDLEIDNVHNYVANGVVIHNSVYRWRGADYRNVKRFENDHPDTKVILLEQNYRSTQNVLDAAMSVINKNHNRTRKQLFTERGTGTMIPIYEAYNEAEEAEYVVSTIATLIKRDELNASDMAIMYRTNAQSRPLEEVFIRGNLPYRLVGATRFYGRREVKDVISFLRLVHNPNDTVSLQRIINVPTRGIGAKTVETLFKAAEIAQAAPSEILLDAERCKKVGGRGGIPLSEFGDVLRGWIESKGELPVAKLIDRILSDVDYNRYINDGTEEGDERWDNVIELRGVAVEYPQITLSEFGVLGWTR